MSKMLNFKEYKEQYLNESSAATRYYEKYPDKIKNIDYTRNNNNFGLAEETIEEIIYSKNIVYRKLEKESLELIKKHIDDINLVFGDGVITYDDIIFVSDFGQSNLNKHINLDKPIPKEYKHLIPIRDKIKAVINYYDNYLTKIGMRKGGISAKSVVDALYAMQKWTIGVFRIDDDEMNVIKSLTVTDNIPNKIYRGFRVVYSKDRKGKLRDYTGNILSDSFKKFIDKLKKARRGDTIKYNFGGYSAWSADISVAEGFANREVPDTKYKIVVSYIPKKEDIVADLRGEIISNITEYHNQQELILNKGEFDFKIEKIIKIANDDELDTSILSKGRLHIGNETGWRIQDTVLSILSLNVVKIIKDEDALEIVNDILKSNITFGELSKQYDFKLDKSELSMSDLYNIHPRIAANFIIYNNTHYNFFRKGGNDYIKKIMAVDLYTMLLINEFNDTITVKFKNYKKLFRKIDYEITNVKINKNNQIKLPDNEISIKDKTSLFLDKILSQEFTTEKNY